MSDTTTQGIRIRVRPFYIAERSNPSAGIFFFAYEIEISNHGQRPAQLLSRHWVITDGDGTQQDVRGPGVVGEQPKLNVGTSFSYTSYCPLPTPVGSMHGAFQMICDGERFDAKISPFTLAVPHALN